jgi:hypothetical protein
MRQANPLIPAGIRVHAATLICRIGGPFCQVAWHLLGQGPVAPRIPGVGSANQKLSQRFALTIEPADIWRKIHYFTHRPGLEWNRLFAAPGSFSD